MDDGMALGFVELDLPAEGLEQPRSILGAAVHLRLAIRLDGDRRDLDDLGKRLLELAARSGSVLLEFLSGQAVFHESASDSPFTSELYARGGFYYLLRIANAFGTVVALSLLLLPGTLFLRRVEWDRGEPIELVGVAFGCSAAFWAVSFWAVRFLPVSWRVLAAGAMAVSLILTVVLRRSAWRATVASWRSKP